MSPLPSLLSSQGFTDNLNQLLLNTGADMPTDQEIDDGSGGGDDYSIQPVAYQGSVARRAALAVGAGAKLVARALQLFGGTAGLALIPMIAQAVGADANQILAKALKKKRGRGRGITGRDLRTTRRTIGKVSRMYAMLQQSFGRARSSGGGRRRRAAPFRPVIVQRAK